MSIILDQLLKEAQIVIEQEKKNKNKLRNKRKAARQAARPQGRGRKKK